MYGPRHIFERHWRLILFGIVVVIALWIFYVLRSILFPFLLGMLLAYILLPLVSWIERRLPRHERWPRFSRSFAIIVIYLVFIVIAGLFFFYLLTTILTALNNLIANSDQIIASATDVIQGWLKELSKHVPAQLKGEFNQFFSSLQTEVDNALRDIVTAGFAFLPATIGLIFGFITLPFFLYLILLDWTRIRDSFYSSFPPNYSEHIKNVITIIGDVLRQYFRGQLILSFFIGSLDFIGLTIIGVGFPAALGFVGALGEFVPVIGPWLNGIIGAIVTLATAPEKVLWVVGFYVAVQMVENFLLVPRIQGNLMRIHPAVVLVVLVVGGNLAGFWGILLALPFTAAAVRVYRYLRKVAAQDDQGKTGPV